MSTNTSYVLTDEEVAESVIKILIYVVGVIGNLLVIFVILFLEEYKKITHWYVLQMALADIIFLQNIPVKLTETINAGWIHSIGMCAAYETVIFFTYYASILFLIAMALDRYLAVCHPLSSTATKIRTSKNSYIIAVVIWIVSLCISIPVMLNSVVVGISPGCKCALEFPIDPTEWCVKNKLGGNQQILDDCINNIYPQSVGGERCTKLNINDGDDDNGDTDIFGSGSGDFFGIGFLNDASSGGTLVDGCHYNPLRRGLYIFILFNFIVMFIVPLVVICICYSLIVYRLMKSNVSTNDSGSQKTDGRIFNPSKKKRKSTTGKSEREKRRVTMLCGLLALLFTVYWLPFHAAHLAKLVGIVGDKRDFCLKLTVATQILAYLSSATNPYLYNFLGSFKKRMRQVRDSKKMKTFLSATGLTRVSHGSSATGTSERSKEQSSSAQHPSEGIPLKTIETNETA